mmetsp:Transcript_32048/g.107904  ORF Transcript_32048/g.107904 Transcript_32048/m.107904 type:complete len:341 (+) Transcript_32048:1640-2662(+)
MSTLCGTHSTARPSRIRASSTSSNSIATRHSFTEDGTSSSARLKTFFRRSGSSSNSAALSQTFVEVGSLCTACAKIALAFAEPLCNRAASSQTSSESGHVSQPSWMILRAAMALPAISSTRAAAIQPGACFGFVVVTDLSKSRAFLMSPTSDAVFTLTELRSVRYPLGSTTVWPVTESDILSSFRPKTVPRAAARPDVKDDAVPATLCVPPAAIGVRQPPMGVLDPPACGVSKPPYACCRASSACACPAKAACDRIESMSESVMGVSFSGRFFCFKRREWSPTSGMPSHSSRETSFSSRFRSANWSLIFGRSSRYFFIVSNSFSSRFRLRLESMRSSIAS